MMSVTTGKAARDPLTTAESVSMKTEGIVSQPTATVTYAVPGRVDTQLALPFIVYEMGPASVLRVARSALEGLFRNREFLALQLDHAWGNVSAAEYEEAAAEYFKTQEQPAPSDLTEQVVILRCLAPAHVTTEAVSQAFGYKLDDVERAFSKGTQILQKFTESTLLLREDGNAGT